MAEVANYDRLEEIGNTLHARSAEGSLDFPEFQQLFAEALAACGGDTDALEMFCPFAKPAGWWDWMMKELQRASSQRVA